MDADQRAFLLESLRLTRNCNEKALLVLQDLQQAAALDLGRDFPAQALTRRYLAEIVTNYQSSADFFAGLQKSFRALPREKAQPRRDRRERRTPPL